MPDLTGTRALVTGARSGIGAKIAEELARSGAIVAVCGRNAGDCEPVVARIRQQGGSAFDHALDVSDIDRVGATVLAAADRLGGLDLVVNNAGTIDPMGVLGQIRPAAFDHLMRVNVTGAFAVVSAAWSHITGNGRVINLSSGAAREPMVGWAAYCASKAALLMLTRSIALEGEPLGIRAFAVAPGLVDTDMQVAIRAAKINRVSDVPRENLLPVERPAELIAWLATGAADDLSGETVDIRDPKIQARLNEAVAS